MNKGGRETKRKPSVRKASWKSTAETETERLLAPPEGSSYTAAPQGCARRRGARAPQAHGRAGGAGGSRALGTVLPEDSIGQRCLM